MLNEKKASFLINAYAVIVIAVSIVSFIGCFLVRFLPKNYSGSDKNIFNPNIYDYIFALVFIICGLGILKRKNVFRMIIMGLWIFYIVNFFYNIFAYHNYLYIDFVSSSISLYFFTRRSILIQFNKWNQS